MYLYERKISKIWLILPLIFLVLSIILLIQFKAGSHLQIDSVNASLFDISNDTNEIIDAMLWSFLIIMLFINIVFFVVVFGSSLKITENQIELQSFFIKNIFSFDDILRIEKAKIYVRAQIYYFSRRSRQYNNFLIQKETGETIKPDYFYKSGISNEGILINLKNNKNIFIVINNDDINKISSILTEKIKS